MMAAWMVESRVVLTVEMRVALMSVINVWSVYYMTALMSGMKAGMMVEMRVALIAADGVAYNHVQLYLHPFMPLLPST